MRSLSTTRGRSPLKTTTSTSRHIQNEKRVIRKDENCVFPLFTASPNGLSQGDKNKTLTLAKPTKKTVFLATVALALVGMGCWQRTAIQAFLHFVKDEWLLTTLDKLDAAGLPGLILYMAVFLIWEMTAGITTPVETAAGMAFGPVKGVVASGIGKFLGAFLTFWLARYAFKDKVQKVVMDGKHEVLQLIEESVEETPLRVALLLRFSPLPEFVKNAGMGVMPVQRRFFIASLILHGLTFTCLWTYMGVETARVLRGLPPSSTLKALMTGVTWLGFSTPVMIGMWIKGLRNKREEKLRRETQEATDEEALVVDESA